MGRETITEVQQTKQTVTYCDICGGAEGTLINTNPENGDTLHYHQDCLDDIRTNTVQHDQSTPRPTLTNSPVITGIRQKRILQEVLLIATWPITGLWVAGTTASPLGADEELETPTQEYIVVLLINIVFTVLLLMLLNIIFIAP